MENSTVQFMLFCLAHKCIPGLQLKAGYVPVQPKFLCFQTRKSVQNGLQTTIQETLSRMRTQVVPANPVLEECPPVPLCPRTCALPWHPGGLSWSLGTSQPWSGAFFEQQNLVARKGSEVPSSQSFSGHAFGLGFGHFFQFFPHGAALTEGPDLQLPYMLDGRGQEGYASSAPGLQQCILPTRSSH